MIGPRERIKSAVESSSLGSISATLADLVSQPSIDVICLNNTIQVAQEVFADAPDDICLPAGIFKNLSILFERRYQQTKELDDLQSSITWAEQGAAAIPRNIDKLHCLNNLVASLISRYEQTGECNDNPNYLNHAIILAENILATAPPGHAIQADSFNRVGVMLATRYDRIGNLEDLQKAITFLELAVAATPLDHPNRAGRLNNLGNMLRSRFERTGDFDDLQQAILQGEEAVAATPLDHPNRAGRLNNLGNMLRSRFERAGDFDDLQQAILQGEEAVAATPLDHPNRADTLTNLGTMLFRRFERTGDFDDLQQAILRVEDAVTATPLDHTDRVGRLNNLGTMLISRFERTGDFDDLQQAILRGEEAVATTPLDLRDRACMLTNLGTILFRRFKRIGAFDDLQQAILRGEEAVTATPLDHPNRASMLNNLGTMLRSRFERTGDFDDLQQAILRGEDAVTATPLDHPDRAGMLTNLGIMLIRRFKRTADFDDLQQAILRGDDAVTATPLDHPDRAGRLNNLGTMLRSRFERTGDFNDLQQAILQGEEAAAATPLDHPDRTVMLNNVGNMFGMRFRRIGAFDDLQQAILRVEEAVAATPLDHPVRAGMLNILGTMLGSRFKRTGDFDDLQQAILRGEEAVAATPLDHPDRAGTLINLGIILILRFERTGDFNDLQQAILRGEEAVTATPLDHPDRANMLNNLGFMLRSRFERTGAFDDLQQAILRVEEAVAATPLDHPDRARRLINLGIILISRFESTKHSHSRECAIKCFTECVALHSAPPTDRINAALQVSPMLAQGQNWADASEVTKTAVNLLPLVSSRSLGKNDQQHLIKQYAGLASRAAAAALEAGKSANNAQQHPQIAKEFEQLRDSLDLSGGKSSISTEPKAPGSSRHSASLELDKIIDKIRQLPNFDQFLLPPTANQLMGAAAAMHPVVLINVSPFRCDAFLIQHHSITVLNLPRLHEETITKVATIMKSRSPTKHQMLDLLQWLWEALAGPVLNKLGFCEPVATEEWPRVCWIPTGPLCNLPIHAAGYHRETGSRTVLDRVISSYSPSIKALLYAHRNVAQRSRSKACNKAVLVSMDTTPGCAELSFARKEIIELESLFAASIPRVVLDAPYKDDVLTALDDCSVFHFAGHGESDHSDPSMSTLLMTDWQKNPLTVKDLVALKFHQNPPLLAYLSACSTGDNRDRQLLDEGIHLMSACQLAGFRHVIGSLWEVSDKHCVDAAKDVYNTMIQAGMSDESVSLGLHNAVLNLRGGRDRTGMTREARDARLIENEESEENRIGDPYIWAAYIHMGI
ncbi:CHAT domain-containing protein [Trichophaea hybrida]|nr:CHAT domain-containing protein [Trichophaea hybrida]